MGTPPTAANWHQVHLHLSTLQPSVGCCPLPAAHTASPLHWDPPGASAHAPWHAEGGRWRTTPARLHQHHRRCPLPRTRRERSSQWSPWWRRGRWTQRPARRAHGVCWAVGPRGKAGSRAGCGTLVGSASRWGAQGALSCDWGSHPWGTWTFRWQQTPPAFPSLCEGPGCPAAAHQTVPSPSLDAGMVRSPRRTRSRMLRGRYT